MKTRSLWMICAVALVAAAPLAKAAPAKAKAAAAATDVESLKKNFQRPTEIPYPKDNAYTDAKNDLGKALYFDPRLSGSNWISCATCHNPGLSYGDGLAKGIGHGMKTLGRRTPTVLNLAWAELLFWDGRADSLEHQALGPIASAGEMNMPLDDMLGKLKNIKGYGSMFEKAYPGKGITKDTIGGAIATFERGIVSGTAPFDKWIKGDKKAISAKAVAGFAVFNGKAKCAQCHTGWAFTDFGFHDIGINDDDEGRFKHLQIDTMKHAFKTPTLRNATRRGPFMHNGSLASLEAVVDYYNKGGDADRPSKSEFLKPLKLSAAEKGELVEFLQTLTSQDKPVTLPDLPM